MKTCVTGGRYGRVDCPLATAPFPTVFIAPSPNGTALNMWVYAEVFSVAQWAIFFAFLLSMAMGLSIISFFCEDDQGITFGTKRGNDININ